MLDLFGEGFAEIMLWFVVGGALHWKSKQPVAEPIDGDLDYARFWVESSYGRSYDVSSWHDPDRTKGRGY